jgi:hypothetical protein
MRLINSTYMNLLSSVSGYIYLLEIDLNLMTLTRRQRLATQTNLFTVARFYTNDIYLAL